jgi:hypothetical protein
MYWNSGTSNAKVAVNNISPTSTTTNQIKAVSEKKIKINKSSHLLIQEDFTTLFSSHTILNP